MYAAPSALAPGLSNPVVKVFSKAAVASSESLDTHTYPNGTVVIVSKSIVNLVTAKEMPLLQMPPSSNHNGMFKNFPCQIWVCNERVTLPDGKKMYCTTITTHVTIKPLIKNLPLPPN